MKRLNDLKWELVRIRRDLDAAWACSVPNESAVKKILRRKHEVQNAIAIIYEAHPALMRHAKVVGAKT